MNQKDYFHLGRDDKKKKRTVAFTTIHATWELPKWWLFQLWLPLLLLTGKQALFKQKEAQRVFSWQQSGAKEVFDTMKALGKTVTPAGAVRLLRGIVYSGWSSLLPYLLTLRKLRFIFSQKQT